MEIIIIFLTILYLVFVAAAEFIAIYLAHVDKSLLINEKLNKISTVEDICRVASCAVIIIDVIFILSFIF